MIFALLSLVACTRGADDKTPLDDTGTTYTAPPVEDCVSNVAMTPSTVRPSVFTVEWDTDGAGTSLVEWGPTAAYGRTTTPSAGTRTHHKVVVAGPKAGATSHFRVVSEVDGVLCGSDDMTFEAGNPPADLPRFELGDVVEGEYTSGFRGVSTFGLLYGLQIVDDDAEPVWWEGFEGEDSDIFPIQAHFVNDNTALAYMLNDATRREDLCEIVLESLDGTELNRGRCPLGHHDFDVLPDGRYVFLYADFRKVEGEDKPVVGDAVHIMDPDGSNLVEIWNAWDELAIEGPIGTDPFYPDALDWTHGNSITYDAGTDSLLLSLHNLSSVFNLTLDGTQIWRLGEGGDFTLEESEKFIDQHAAKFVPGSATDIVLFDNGDIDDRDAWSESARYRLDATAMTAERVWVEDHDQTYRSLILGDTWVVGDDNYFVSWGSKGEMGEYTAEGELVWRANGGSGYATGYVSHHEMLGGVIE